ncbi:uncharacterized protein LOC121514763 isoform X2 [Cheilinus undulatus]|uniref:uncharacterized protein LOC121514763 isoform X2 n=1 Tax=Cheilinus undulatus TaxID=241271 RepID=UPI001BD5496D|nr:uncharacterized protein LOC121514763 isoform X2 [Cheilinus undulatus]
MEENNSEEVEIQEVFSSSLSDSTQQCKSISPIEEVCCVEMLKQIFYGSGTASGECQCQKEQSRNEVTDPTADEGMAAEPGKQDVFVIEFDGESEEENPAKGPESTDTQMITFTKTSYPHEDEESNTIPSSVISNPSNIMFMSENEVNGGSRSDDRNSEQPADLEDGSGQAQERTNNSKITNQPREDSEVQSEIQSDNSVDDKQDQPSHVLPDLFSRESELEESSGRGQLASEDLGETPSENIEEQRVTLKLSQATVMRKEKRLHNHDQLHSSKKLKKCPKGFYSAQTSEDVPGSRDSLADHQPSTSHYRTVKLALFGSPQQDECHPSVSKKTPPGAESIGSPSPPGVISVLVSPLKRKPSKPAPAEEPSVKLRIYEKWRKSLYQSQIMHRCTLRIQKMRLKKSGLKQTVVSEKRREKGTRKLLSKLIKQRKEKLKRDVAVLRNPADQQTQDAEERSYTVRPLQDKNVLVFSVLPTSFSLQDGPSEMETQDDPAPSETKPVEIKSSETAVSREKVKHADRLL